MSIRMRKKDTMSHATTSGVPFLALNRAFSEHLSIPIHWSKQTLFRPIAL